jgi:phosphonate transport system substrate-binding protein
MRFISVAITLCLLAVSCSQKPEDIAKVEPKNIRESAFTIAILPEQNVFEQKKRYRPLAEYLSDTLNVNVKIKLLDSYGSIYDEIKNRTIDAAFFGSFNYVLTRARADIEPIARPVEIGGNSNYRGIIFTRKDSDLNSDIRTWKGKRISLVHEVTTAGYIFPRWYLKRHGIDNFEKYFRRIIFSGSHDAAILAVLKGQADIGAAKDLIFKKLLSENPAIRDEIVVLAESISVPSNSLCVRADLKNNIKSSLKKTLLSMHNTDNGRTALAALNAERFIETSDSEFNELRQMAGDIGIDIRTYQFRDSR